MIYTEVQNASTAENIPGPDQFQRWLETALADLDRDIEVVIRIVDEPESAELNQQYRQKSGPTNVLSFPVELPEGVSIDLIGDLVICAPVVEAEARQQNKPQRDHWTHMVVHGVLHLLGYDHIEESQAEIMEAIEVSILKKMNINNPYTEAPRA